MVKEINSNIEQWKRFSQEVINRIISPWNPIFFFYFIICLIIGGLGVILIIFNIGTQVTDGSLNIAKGLGTYFIALMAVSYADISLNEKLSNYKAFQQAGLLILVFGALLLVLSFNISPNWVYLPAILGLILSLLMWIVANAKSKKFEEKSYDSSVREDAKSKGIGKNWK